MDIVLGVNRLSVEGGGFFVEHCWRAEAITATDGITQLEKRR